MRALKKALTKATEASAIARAFAPDGTDAVFTDSWRRSRGFGFTAEQVEKFRATLLSASPAAEEPVIPGGSPGEDVD
eukprot:3191453-Amphidinium_carterae.1